MRERPILFSGAMVRAILDGRKTQTRRIVKSQPPETYDYGDEDDSHTGMILREQPSEFMGKAYWRYGAHWGSQPRLDLPFPTCPYGVPGDRLWVRETWQAIHVWTDPETGYGEDLTYPETIPTVPGRYWSAVWAADDPQATAHKDDRGFPWRPSIHMPRWASRILLEVVSVRVERLQDISEEDARAEGVTPLQMDDGAFVPRFMGLWDLINSKRAPWQSNPWVWVVEFKRVEESR